MDQAEDADVVSLQRSMLKFPLEIQTPEGFEPDDPATWPKVPGRLEYVRGRLLYMPPCGEEQMYTAVAVTSLLFAWCGDHKEFRTGGNEAGMRLGGDSRGADGAVWRVEPRPVTRKFQRVPPILAVEVAGEEEGEAELRTKASWYFANNVVIVWLVLPSSREVVVLTRDSERRYRMGEQLAEHPALPKLAPLVEQFFAPLGPI